MEEKNTEKLDERRQMGALERHIQTIMATISAAAILASASFIYNTHAQLDVMKEHMETISVQITDLRADLKALQQNYVTREDFKDHEARIRVLEAKTDKTVTK